MLEANFIELIVSESNLKNLEGKTDELASFLLTQTVSQGLVINFLNINLKINKIEPAGANKITSKAEISIMPVKEEIIPPPAQPKPPVQPKAVDVSVAKKKKGTPSVAAIISIIVTLFFLSSAVFGLFKSGLIEKASTFLKGRKKITAISSPVNHNAIKPTGTAATKPSPRLSNKELAELIYPGKVVSNFIITESSQGTVTKYKGCPGFFIKTSSYEEFFSGNPTNLNTIAIVGKQYADLTGDRQEELVVATMGDDKILPDCMAALSVNNVIVYKWTGSRYEELWRTNMNLGQEGTFEKLEIKDSNNDGKLEIQLYGNWFTHGEGDKFCDFYQWDGNTFVFTKTATSKDNRADSTGATDVYQLADQLALAFKNLDFKLLKSLTAPVLELEYYSSRESYIKTFEKEKLDEYLRNLLDQDLWLIKEAFNKSGYSLQKDKKDQYSLSFKNTRYEYITIYLKKINGSWYFKKIWIGGDA